MMRNSKWKIVKNRYRLSSKYRMQLEFSFPEYLIGQCRFSTKDTQEIKKQKISLSMDGIIFSDTIPLSWFTSSTLVPWAKVIKFTVLDKLPAIDGVVNTPWPSDLNTQTHEFKYCSIELNDPLEMTIDLPWSEIFTNYIQKKKPIDI